MIRVESELERRVREVKEAAEKGRGHQQQEHERGEGAEEESAEGGTMRGCFSKWYPLPQRDLCNLEDDDDDEDEDDEDNPGMQHVT